MLVAKNQHRNPNLRIQNSNGISMNGKTNQLLLSSQRTKKKSTLLSVSGKDGITSVGNKISNRHVCMVVNWKWRWCISIDSIICSIMFNIDRYHQIHPAVRRWIVNFISIFFFLNIYVSSYILSFYFLIPCVYHVSRVREFLNIIWSICCGVSLMA